jgi:phytoene dehydrogenase-like protein
MADFDAVVIGSGVGGLAAAALLARVEGKSILVLERHSRAGGLSQTFERKGGFRWDVGLHYVGDLTQGFEGAVFRVMTGGASWSRMADPFERLLFPGFQFDIRAGREEFAHDLRERFPAEAGAIGRFLADVDRAAGARLLPVWRALTPRPVAWLAEALQAPRLRLGRATTGEVLRRHFRSPELRALLGARWLNYGLPPAQSAFAIHAIVFQHYLRGGYYPVGSAASIVAGARAGIEAAGGSVRLREPVERILLEHGRVAGVRLESGEEIRARLVISDAGARTTYQRLLPPDARLPFRAELDSIPPGMAAVVLYLGLTRSPEAVGVRGENLWFHDSIDQDDLAARARQVLTGRPPYLYVSFPSLKDPGATAHTAEVMAPVDGAAFARWAGTSRGRRGSEYLALKERIADGMLETIERSLPGFSALVAHREVSTPLTTESYTSHPGGEIYGLPFTPERLRRGWLGVRTPVPGLFLAGADAHALGIVGAMMGGAMAAAAATSPRLIPRIKAAATALKP